MLCYNKILLLKLTIKQLATLRRVLSPFIRQLKTQLLYAPCCNFAKNGVSGTPCLQMTIQYLLQFLI